MSETTATPAQVEAAQETLREHVIWAGACSCGWKTRLGPGWQQHADEHMARVVGDAVVAAQRDEAGAEVARLRRDYSLAAKYRDEYRDDAHSASQALLEMIDAREAAEARYADLRKRIEALADEWARTVYKLPPGYPMTVNKFCHLRFTAPLRAALAAEPTLPAEPDAEGGA